MATAHAFKNAHKPTTFRRRIPVGAKNDHSLRSWLGNVPLIAPDL